MVDDYGIAQFDREPLHRIHVDDLLQLEYLIVVDLFNIGPPPLVVNVVNVDQFVDQAPSSFAPVLGGFERGLARTAKGID